MRGLRASVRAPADRGGRRVMADRDPVQPIHQPVLPVFDEEEVWVQQAAERFEDAAAEELLAWALERFHPRLAISAAGGVDGDRKSTRLNSSHLVISYAHFCLIK